MKPHVSDVPASQVAVAKAPHFYALAWRWHFYAGLYVVPFLTMLALTGLVMVFFTGFQDRLGWPVTVRPQAQAKAVTVQARAVLDAFPQATLKEYVAPRTADAASWFVLKYQGATQAVAVDPYSASVLKAVDKEKTVFAWAEKIHGTLLLGDVGDRLIEVAAGLGMVMIVSGLYLWWPRREASWAQVLVPNFKARGRQWWKSLHASVGFWIAVVLALFLLTGLAWSGIWGGKLVQPWSTFPEAKWDNVPKSDANHASLNPEGLHEVPWGLELARLPASGSSSGVPGVPLGQPVNLDGVAHLAHTLGFRGQHHIQVPQDADGVYTISADSMSGDLSNPWEDRTVHVDRYSGRVLAQAAFADYPLLAKAMAVGIALHQGDLGLWSAWLNVVFCLGVVFLCVSGSVMWWMRRPVAARRLVAPPMPQNLALWKTGAAVMVVTALAFPLTGAVLLGLMVLDGLVIDRMPRVKRALG